MREGTGTIRRFIGDTDVTIIGIERVVGAPVGKLTEHASIVRTEKKFFDKGTCFLTCDPALARALLARYGNREEGGFIDMSSIIGAPCRYVESACGMLVRLDVLQN